MNKRYILLITLFSTTVCASAQIQNNLSLNWAVANNTPSDALVISYVNDYLNAFSKSKDTKTLDKYWIKPILVADSGFDLGLEFLIRGFEVNDFMNHHQAILLTTNWLPDSICKASVLFLRTDSLPLNDRGKVRAIYEYNVKINNGQPRFINNLDLFIQSAHNRSFRGVDYYYQNKKCFKLKDAKKTSILAKKFKVYFDPDNEPFTLIICQNKHELGLNFNFQFTYTARTSGVATKKDRYLISALNSAYYGHETIHIWAPQTTPGFLWEGLATYFGGGQNLTYEEFIREDDRLDTSTIKEIIYKEEINWYYTYVFGSLLTDFLINDLDIDSYELFFNTFNNFSELIEILESDYNIDKQKLTTEIISKFRLCKSQSTR